MKIDNFELIFYNEQHKDIKDEFIFGESSSKFINNIENRLSIKPNEDFFNHGYLVKYKDNVVAYLYVSGITNDNIYLEYSVLNKYRNQKIASNLINSITNYIFNNFNINEIKLNISKDNRSSQKVAENCGYYLDDEEEYLYTDKSDFVINNPYYINKKRNWCFSKYMILYLLRWNYGRKTN